MIIMKNKKIIEIKWIIHVKEEFIPQKKIFLV